VKAFKRVIIAVVAASILLVAACASWLFMYSGDLPRLEAIDNFAPTTAGVTTDECVAPQALSVVPYTALGTNVSRATRAAERNIEMQIARSVLCQYHGKNIPRILLEYKASIILKTRFTSDQLLTIYLNRVYFGAGITGVAAASKHYYGITPDQLSLPQAAMIIGLIEAPSYYLPERYPDRCRDRRDEVVNAMLRHGDITIQEAKAAKEAPLI
jgi:membrane carboxypeptidase/penicillin-binding protein